MTRSGAVAFGRYLRTLRERRGLSLLEVSSLSASSPQPLDKGTLSRLERGQQRPPLLALSPLCRIYGVSADALLERFELDAQLERAGEPDVRGLDARELRRLGQKALAEENRKWEAYGYFREALHAAEDEAARCATREAERERVRAALNLATVTRSLGRNRLALEELRFHERSGALEDRWRPVVLDRISNCYRCLEDFGPAEHYADEAIAEAARLGEKRALAFALFSRASLAFDRGETSKGIEDLRGSLTAYREAGGTEDPVAPDPGFEATALVRLSEAYLDLGLHDKAARAAQVARRFSTAHSLPAARAYSELFLGYLDERAGRTDRAIRRWRRVAEEAERLHNPRLGFSAEFCVYRSTRAAGLAALARASRQRLERLAPWVPAHHPLLKEFRSESVPGAPASPSPRNRARRRAAIGADAI